MTHPDPPNGPQDNPWQSGQPSPESSEESSATGQPQEHRPNEADQPTQINPAIRPDQPQPEQPQPEQPQPEQQPEQQADQGQFGQGQFGPAQDEPTQDLSAQGGQPPAGQWQQPGQQQWQGQSQPSANQPGQWQGQPSANQWQTAEGGQWAHSQPSAGQQPPAGQQAHQPGYPQSQGSGSFAGQPQYPGAQPQTQPTYPGWQQPQKDQPTDANPLRAAFDFSFSRYATPGLVKIIYILAVILAALWWLGGTLVTFIAGIAGSAYGSSGGGIVLGFVFLLLGWIPALLEILFVRVVLEAMMALVRVAEDARGIRTKIDE